MYAERRAQRGHLLVNIVMTGAMESIRAFVVASPFLNLKQNLMRVAGGQASISQLTIFVSKKTATPRMVWCEQR